MRQRQQRQQIERVRHFNSRAGRQRHYGIIEGNLFQSLNETIDTISPEMFEQIADLETNLKDLDNIERTCQIQCRNISNIQRSTQTKNFINQQNHHKIRQNIQQQTRKYLKYNIDLNKIVEQYNEILSNRQRQIGNKTLVYYKNQLEQKYLKISNLLQQYFQKMSNILKELGKINNLSNKNKKQNYIEEQSFSFGNSNSKQQKNQQHSMQIQLQQEINQQKIIIQRLIKPQIKQIILQTTMHLKSYFKQKLSFPLEQSISIKLQQTEKKIMLNKIMGQQNKLQIYIEDSQKGYKIKSQYLLINPLINNQYELNIYAQQKNKFPLINRSNQLQKSLIKYQYQQAYNKDLLFQIKITLEDSDNTYSYIILQITQIGIENKEDKKVFVEYQLQTMKLMNEHTKIKTFAKLEATLKKKEL